MTQRAPSEMNNAELAALKQRIDTRLNAYLCEMEPDYDDSITGFNKAWDVVRAIFDDEAARRLARPVEDGDASEEIVNEIAAPIINDCDFYRDAIGIVGIHTIVKLAVAAHCRRLSEGLGKP